MSLLSGLSGTAEKYSKDKLKFGINITSGVFGKIKYKDEKGVEQDRDAGYLDLFKAFDPNSLENYLDKTDYSRKIFEDSIRNPLEFIKQKNDARAQIAVTVKKIRSDSFSDFLKMNLSPPHAEKISSMIAKEMYDLLNKVLEEEIYPSKLESEIMNLRYNKKVSELTSPLKTSMNASLEKPLTE